MAYAIDAERGLLRRTVDRSEAQRTPHHHMAGWSDVDGEAEPWNAEPEAREWRSVLPVRATR